MKPWKIALLVLLSLVALAFFGGFFGVKLYVKKRYYSNLSPDERKAYDKWHTEKLTFSEEEFNTKPFDPETVAAARDFLSEWEKRKADAHRLSVRIKRYMKTESAGAHSTADDPDAAIARTKEWEEMEAKLPAYESLFLAFERLVERPDYEVDILAAATDPSKGTKAFFPEHDPLWRVSHLLQLKSLGHTKRGDYARALESADLILRASKLAKFPTFAAFKTTLYLPRTGARALFQAVERCDDPELLRRALKRQNALADGMPSHARDLDQSVLLAMGIVRIGRKIGVEASLANRTGEEIWGESVLVMARYLERRTLPLLSKDPDAAQKVREKISGYQDKAQPFSGEVRNLRGIGYAMFAPEFSLYLYSERDPYLALYFPFTHSDTARAYLDLLRLETARKLYTLEHDGREPGGIGDLVGPGYLPEIPKDIYAKDGRPYGRANGAYYSIGPDLKDDKAATGCYGNIGNSGDVFLSWREAETKANN